jgi:hypothetical protein
VHALRLEGAGRGTEAVQVQQVRGVHPTYGSRQPATLSSRAFFAKLTPSGEKWWNTPRLRRKGASRELIERSVAVILAQARGGAGHRAGDGALLGLIVVPMPAGCLFLAWYVVFAVAMLARQPYFTPGAGAPRPTERTLHRIAWARRSTGWFGRPSVPVFSPYLGVTDVGVLTMIRGLLGLAGASRCWRCGRGSIGLPAGLPGHDLPRLVRHADAQRW